MVSPPCLIVALALLAGNACAEGHWNYEKSGDSGPTHWKDEYPHCNGSSQSPINIQATESEFDRSLEYFDFSTYDIYDEEVKMTLSNAGGHTAKVTLSGNPVYIGGGSLPVDYQLLQFHFHWGSEVRQGSEHTIDGFRFPMELHLVHGRDDKTSEEPEGLAVISFLFETGDHNPNFDKILEYFSSIKFPEQSVEIGSFSVNQLLPTRWFRRGIDYWRYHGSLTTPPCSESVIWSVMDQTITISHDQLEQFRDLRAQDGAHYLQNNFRPVQPLNGRVVSSTTWYWFDQY